MPLPSSVGQEIQFSTTAAFVPAGSAPLRCEGRSLAVDGALRLGFPGVTLRLLAEGGPIAVRIDAESDDVYFDARSGDGDWLRFRARRGLGDYLLATPGSGEPLAISLLRRTESWQGCCKIVGVALGGEARLLSPPPAPEKKLLFIGDSVTSGESTDLRPGEAPLGIHRANARLSFGMELARRLGAQCHLVSYGGRGILRDWQGNRDTATAAQFYERALPDEPASRWDHSSYVPDLICVELGTNDFNPGIPDRNEFVSAYVSFVRKLRADAPRAAILLAESPILHDAAGEPAKRTRLREYLEDTIASARLPAVRLAPIGHYVGTPADAHPTGDEHRRIADELEPAFRAELFRAV